MVEKKKCVGAVLMVAVLLMVSVLPTLAATESSSTGSFSLGNVAPGAPIVTLYQDDESNTTTQMTPQTEYAIKIEASDPNGLEDIMEITVYIYYGTNSSDEPSSDNPQTQATYKWVKGSGWSLVGPTGSTWGIDTSESRGPENNTTTSGTWWLHFIPGKVATETDGNDMWIIKVVVKDQSNATNFSKQANIQMNWYGEIQVEDGSFDFGTVDLGSTDNPIINPSDGKIDVKTISNGLHKIEAKTDAQWSTTEGNTVNVRTSDESPGAGEIVLEHNSDNDETLAAVVQTDYADVPGLTSLSQTTEDGTTSPIYMWLSVGSEGISAGTYQGTYYVQVVNA